jgi:hypothetical protein
LKNEQFVVYREEEFNKYKNKTIILPKIFKVTCDRLVVFSGDYGSLH